MKNFYQATLVALAMILTFSAAWADEALVAKTPAPAAAPVKKNKVVKKIKPAPKAKAGVAEKDVWICPMCRIKSDKPGKCPECGMDMVKLPKDPQKTN